MKTKLNHFPAKSLRINPKSWKLSEKLAELIKTTRVKAIERAIGSFYDRKLTERLRGK